MSTAPSAGAGPPADGRLPEYCRQSSRGRKRGGTRGRLCRASATIVHFLAVVGERPKLALPRTPLERVLQVLAAGSVAALLIFMVSVWSRLPQTVPIHFGIDGTPDAWGDRSTLLLLPAIVVAL